MDRENLLKNTRVNPVYEDLSELHQILRQNFTRQFDRSLPFGDELFDRWERAKYLNFAPGASIYDSSYVFGNIKVGEKTWIGPFTILDGTGGLEIGSYCMISAGVQIYTHDNVKWSLSAGKSPFDYQPVKIGDCCYIAPQCIIAKGVEIGDHSIVAANSFVNKSFPAFSVVAGSPARQIGRTVVENEQVHIEYFTKSS